MKKRTKTLLTCLAVPLGVGAVSGFLTQGSMDTFEKLNQPPLAPPGWVFPVVWTGLFAMMGTASYLIARLPESEEKKKALTLYGIQLAVNFLWPVFFFNAGWYLFSFAWLLLLWYLVYLCTKGFADHLPEKAGYLMIPYLVWLTFAGYLNFCYLSFELIAEALSENGSVFVFYRKTSDFRTKTALDKEMRNPVI